MEMETRLIINLELEDEESSFLGIVLVFVRVGVDTVEFKFLVCGAPASLPMDDINELGSPVAELLPVLFTAIEGGALLPAGGSGLLPEATGIGGGGACGKAIVNADKIIKL